MKEGETNEDVSHDSLCSKVMCELASHYRWGDRERLVARSEYAYAASVAQAFI